GIVRHLEWDNFLDGGTQIPPAQRADLLKELTALAEKKEPPAGRSLAGHNWMRRRAVEALALAGAKKTDAAVAATIDKILADDTDSLMVRCAAASATGRMTYLPPLKLDPLDAAKKLGFLALVVCDT